MIDSKLFNYSVGYLKNFVFSNLYLNFGINICKPASISALLTWKCNARCLMCDHWRRKKHDEMSKEEWMTFLTDLKKWHSNAHVQFSGGEPFVRKDAIEIFEHCAAIDLSYGITTNFGMIPYGGVGRLVGANPFNINISIDGIKNETHDYCRGVQGFLGKVVGNLEKVLEEMARQKRKIRIILKTTVMNKNVGQLEEIVKFTADKGLAGVNFQPIFKWSDESEGLSIKDIEAIEKVSERLIDMKKNGYPILTPERDISSWTEYFKEETPKQINRGKCVVGIKNFDILPNGDVFLCRSINSKIGNLTFSRPSDIWHSESTNVERERILKCKKLCLATCMTKRTLKEQFSAFYKMAHNKQ